jgi:hypothetical protein
VHDDGREIAGVVDMHVRKKNLFEAGKIVTASSDALESSTAGIDENARLPVDGHEVSRGRAMRICNRAAAPENGYGQS